VEAELLRAAYPDYDQKNGWLGHNEGFLVVRSSACVPNGLCFLALAASTDPSDSGAGAGHAWTTFLALRLTEGAWVETAHTAGPVITGGGRWLIGLSVLIDDDGPFFTVTTSNKGSDEGDSTATHIWNWEGKKFVPVLTAATTRQGAGETQGSFTLCADRQAGKPSWELRTREREGRGAWTENKVRVIWSGQAWAERPAERPCLEHNERNERLERSADVASSSAAASSAKVKVKVKSASASKTGVPPKGHPRATAPANAIDGNPRTAWVAGGKKGGVGEWLQLDLAAPAAIGSLQILGTCPSNDWKASPRIKRIRLRFEDGPAQEETLADAKSAQAVVVRR
jgi:hypothetical protein